MFESPEKYAKMHPLETFKYRENVARIFNSFHVMPTLLGLMDIPVPKEVDGIDYSWDLQKGKLPDVTSEYTAAFSGANLVTMGMKPWRGIRTPRYTYAFDENGPWVLFDNEKDPYQYHNQIGKSQYKLLQEKMHQELINWIDRIDEQNLREFI